MKELESTGKDVDHAQPAIPPPQVEDAAAVAPLLRSNSGIARRAESARAARSGADLDGAATDLVAEKSGGAPLDSVGAGLASKVGADPAGVRVHNGGEGQSQKLDTLGARAVTVGSDMFFAPGQYDTSSKGGQKLVAHELTHVAQQEGASAPGGQAKLEVGASGDAYEQQADGVAEAVVEGGARPAVSKGAFSAQRAQRHELPPKGGGTSEVHSLKPGDAAHAPGAGKDGKDGKDKDGKDKKEEPIPPFGLTAEEWANLQVRWAVMTTVFPLEIRWLTAMGPWMNMLALAKEPKSQVLKGPNPKEFADLVLEIRLANKPGAEQFSAFLTALPKESKQYLDIFNKADAAANKDRDQVAALATAIDQLVGGAPEAGCSTTFLGAYLALEGDTKRYLSTHKYLIEKLTGYLGVVNTESVPPSPLLPRAKVRDAMIAMLSRQSPAAVKEDAAAAVAADKPGKSADPAAAHADTPEETKLKHDAAMLKGGIERSIAHCTPDNPLSEGQRQVLVGEIANADPKVRDLLYADTALLKDIRDKTSAKDLSAMLQKLDTASDIPGKCVEITLGALRHEGPPVMPGPAVIAILRPYCEAHPGPAGQAARDRINQDNAFHSSCLALLGEPYRSQALRLVITGNIDPTPVDAINDAARAKDAGKLGEAIEKLIQDKAQVEDLKSKLQFHQVLMGFSGTVPVGGMDVKPYEFMRQLWGIPDVTAGNLPGQKDKQTEANAGAPPPAPEDIRRMERVVIAPSAAKLHDELHPTLHTSDSTVMGYCTDYEQSMAAQPWRDYCRGAGIAPGPRLVQYYAQQYDEDIRQRLDARHVTGAERQTTERVLGIRLDSAASPDLQKGQDPNQPKAPISLEQALREIACADGHPITYHVHECARKLEKEICHSTFSVYISYIEEYYWAMYHPVTDKLDDVAKATGKPKPDVDLMLQKAYAEIGGDLATDIAKYCDKADIGRAQSLTGCDAKTVEDRKFAGDTAKQRKDMLEKGLQKNAQALFKALEDAKDLTAVAAIPGLFAVAQNPTPDGLPAKTKVSDEFDGAKELPPYYKTEFGISLAKHASKTADRIAKDTKTDRDALIKKMDLGDEKSGAPSMAEVKASRDELQVRDGFSVSPGFDADKAAQQADNIWAELSRPDAKAVIVSEKLAGFQPEEQRLILAQFRQKTGLELRYYIQANINRTPEYVQAGDMPPIKVKHDQADNLESTAAENQRLLDLTDQSGKAGKQQGKTQILTRLKLACDDGPMEAIYRTLEEAKPEDLQAVLDDGPTMDKLRGYCNHYEWERVYKTLTGQLDMMEILQSRNHKGMFGRTDTDGIKKDIKAYIEQRQDKLTEEVKNDEKFKGAPKDAVDKEVARRLQEEMMIIFANKGVEDQIHQSLSNWHRGHSADESEVQSMMLHGGQAAASDAVLTGTDFTTKHSAILDKLRAARPEELVKMRNDPEFMRNLEESVGSKRDDMKDALDILWGPGAAAGGADNVAKLEDYSRASNILGHKTEIRETLLKLSPAELKRVSDNVALCSQILTAVEGTDYEKPVRQMLSIKTESASTKGMTPADAKKSELQDKLNMIFAMTKEKLLIASSFSWKEILRVAQVVYNQECKPDQEPGAPPPEPGAPPVVDLFPKKGEARKTLWAQVGSQVATNLGKSGVGAPLGANIVIQEAVLGEIDPTVTRFGAELGKIRGRTDSDKHKDVLENVSNEYLVQAWVTAAKSNPPPGGSANETLEAKYGLWKDAREARQAKKPDPPKPKAGPPPEVKKEDLVANAPAVDPSKMGPKPPEGMPALQGAMAQTAGPQPQQPANLPTADETKKKAAEPTPEDLAVKALIKQEMLAKANFSSFELGVSQGFEDLVLAKTGGSDTDSTTADEHQKGGLKDNKEYFDYKKIIYQKILALPGDLIGTAIKADGDAEAAPLLNGRTRKARENLSFGTEEMHYQTEHDTSGSYAFAQGERNNMAVAHEDYRRAVGDEQVNPDTKVELGGSYGEVSEEGEGRIKKKQDAFNEAVSQFKEAKERAAHWAAMIVGALVAVIVTVLTAGAAGPLMIALAGAAVGASSALAEQLVTKAIMGGDKDLDLVKDVGTAAVMGFVTSLGGYWARAALARVGEVKQIGKVLAAFDKAVEDLPGFQKAIVKSGLSGVNMAADTGFNAALEAGGKMLNPINIFNDGWNQGWAENQQEAKSRIATVPGEMWGSFATGFVQHALTTGVKSLTGKGKGEHGEGEHGGGNKEEGEHASGGHLPGVEEPKIPKVQPPQSNISKQWHMLVEMAKDAPIQTLAQQIVAMDLDPNTFLEKLAENTAEGAKSAGMMFHREQLISAYRLARSQKLLASSGDQLTEKEKKAYLDFVVNGQTHPHENLPGHAEDLVPIRPEIWVEYYRKAEAEAAAKHAGDGHGGGQHDPLTGAGGDSAHPTGHDTKTPVAHDPAASPPAHDTAAPANETAHPNAHDTTPPVTHPDAKADATPVPAAVPVEGAKPEPTTTETAKPDPVVAKPDPAAVKPEAVTPATPPVAAETPKDPGQQKVGDPPPPGVTQAPGDASPDAVKAAAQESAKTQGQQAAKNQQAADQAATPPATETAPTGTTPGAPDPAMVERARKQAEADKHDAKKQAEIDAAYHERDQQNGQPPVAAEPAVPPAAVEPTKAVPPATVEPTKTAPTEPAPADKKAAEPEADKAGPRGPAEPGAPPPPQVQAPAPQPHVSVHQDVTGARIIITTDPLSGRRSVVIEKGGSRKVVPYEFERGTGDDAVNYALQRDGQGPLKLPITKVPAETSPVTPPVEARTDQPPPTPPVAPAEPVTADKTAPGDKGSPTPTDPKVADATGVPLVDPKAPKAEQDRQRQGVEQAKDAKATDEATQRDQETADRQAREKAEQAARDQQAKAGQQPTVAEVQETEAAKATREAAEAEGKRKIAEAAEKQRLNDEYQAKARKETAKEIKDNETNAKEAGVADQPGVELHNHFMGIVPVSEFIKHPGLGNGSVEQLLVRLQEIVSKDPDFSKNYELDPENPGKKRVREKNPNLVGDGQQQAFENVKVIEDAVKEIKPLQAERDQLAKDDPKRKELQDKIDKIANQAVKDALIASQRTPFDGAYSIRDAAIKDAIDPAPLDKDGNPNPKARTYENYTEMTIRALLIDGIKYSEQSQSVKKLQAQFPPEMIKRVMEKMRAEGLPVTELRFLAMIETKFLGSEAATKEGVQGVGDADFQKQREQLGQMLAGRKDVVGVDIASPERFPFDKTGISRFKQLAETLQQAAKGRVATDPETPGPKPEGAGRVLVLRPHVGEGYVVPEAGEAFDRDHGAIGPDGVPVAVTVARENMKALIQAVRELRSGTPPVLTGDPKVDGVEIRFGHSTHATPEIAKEMKELNIIAEVNLDSNIMTGSLPQKTGPKEAGKPAERTGPNQFDDHSLLHLVAAGTKVILSTDAQSVMDTTLWKEYATAKFIIEQFKNGDTTMRISGPDELADPSQFVPDKSGEMRVGYKQLSDKVKVNIDAGYKTLVTDADAYGKQQLAHDAVDKRGKKDGGTPPGSPGNDNGRPPAPPSGEQSKAPAVEPEGGKKPADVVNAPDPETAKKALAPDPALGKDGKSAQDPAEPGKFSREQFPTPDLIQTKPGGPAPAQPGDFWGKVVDETSRRDPILQKQLADAKSDTERQAILEQHYQELQKWRASIEKDPARAAKIEAPLSEPNNDPFGNMSKLDPASPAAKERAAIGDVIAQRFKDSKQDGDKLQNVVTLPTGEQVPGNTLLRGAEAEKIHQEKEEKEAKKPEDQRNPYAYGEKDQKFITQTASPEAQQKLHAAGIATISELMGQAGSLKTADPAAREAAQHKFAEALYFLIQAPLFNRGSDTTIRMFGAMTFHQIFGEPLMVPHDIDVRAMAMDQGAFASWFVGELAKAKAKNGGGGNTPPPVAPATPPTTNQMVDPTQPLPETAKDKTVDGKDGPQAKGPEGPDKGPPPKDPNTPVVDPKAPKPAEEPIAIKSDGKHVSVSLAGVEVPLDNLPENVQAEARWMAAELQGHKAFGPWLRGEAAPPPVEAELTKKFGSTPELFAPAPDFAAALAAWFGSKERIERTPGTNKEGKPVEVKGANKISLDGFSAAAQAKVKFLADNGAMNLYESASQAADTGAKFDVLPKIAAIKAANPELDAAGVAKLVVAQAKAEGDGEKFDLTEAQVQRAIEIRAGALGQHSEVEQRLATGLAPGSIEVMTERARSASSDAGIDGEVEVFVTGGGSKTHKQVKGQPLTFGVDEDNDVDLVVVVKPKVPSVVPTQAQLAKLEEGFTGLTVMGVANQKTEKTTGQEQIPVRVDVKAMTEAQFFGWSAYPAQVKGEREASVLEHHKISNE